MRLIAALGLGAVLALGGSLGLSGEAEASKKKASAKAKLCSATNTQTGKKVSWRCDANQICCYNATTNKSSCSPSTVTGFCL